jgi:glyoxylase-like metal-dependent hydrolase (beta-lactamase superfamily II)
MSKSFVIARHPEQEIAMTAFVTRTTLPLATATVLGLAASASAVAAGDMADGPNPGYYRMMLGDFEVTALSDGTVNLPMHELLHMPADEARAIFEDAYLNVPVETSVNAYLINTGDTLVLVDTGAGTLFGPTLGKLGSSLEAAGYRPEQVDEIYLTHMHPDHLGGLMDGESRMFPNATLHADQDDVDFWLDPAQLEAAPEGQKGFFQGAMASINPYIEAGAFEAFEGDTELAPGIYAEEHPGHTPGHSTYRVESNGETLVLWGDTMHAAAVQFPHPDVTIDFDSVPDQAREARKAIFATVAEEGDWVAGAHLSFPGIGHLRADGEGYEWLPVNYTHEPAAAAGE